MWYIAGPVVTDAQRARLLWLTDSTTEIDPTEEPVAHVSVVDETFQLSDTNYCVIEHLLSSTAPVLGHGHPPRTTPLRSMPKHPSKRSDAFAAPPQTADGSLMRFLSIFLILYIDAFNKHNRGKL